MLNFTHASSSRASDFPTWVIALVISWSTRRSMRSSSFSQSLTAMKAILEEFSMKSRRLKAASLATKQDCRTKSVSSELDRRGGAILRFADILDNIHDNESPLKMCDKTPPYALGLLCDGVRACSPAYQTFIGSREGFGGTRSWPPCLHRSRDSTLRDSP